MRSARNRGHKQYFVPVLERVRRPSDEANIFFIHVDIQEPPRLPSFIPQVGLQIGELGVEVREQIIEIPRRANNPRRARSKPPQAVGISTVMLIKTSKV
jgi:hypothetical protein